ncbi:MAG: type II secretion system secretin GspD [Bryobacteraceae bacterium]
MRSFWFCLILAATSGALAAQAVPGAPPQPALEQQQPQPPAQPPPAPAPPVVTQPQAAPARLSDNGPFSLTNASLTEMIDILAKRLRINYILDPSVKGTVSIYTYGEIKSVDEMQILETILRINGFAMVQVGDLYRIVPAKMVQQLPLAPSLGADAKTLPDDERMILNLVFLKYATAAEIMKIVQPFQGEGGQITTYDPANLLIIEDNSRNMKRTMELISMFDSDTLAGQRVKLFDVTNSRPSDLVKDLESVFKAYALSDKSPAAVRFIPVDRINTLIAVAPNPGIFTEVKTWIDKLDIPVKAPAGASDLFYYRLKYGRAETVAMAIMAVLTGNPYAMVGLAAQSAGGIGAGAGMGYGGGAYGGVGGGMGMGGVNSGYAGMPYSGMAYGNAYSGYPGASGYQTMAATSPAAAAAAASPIPLMGTGVDLTGTYLGAAGATGGSRPNIPSVIPNPFDNTILVRGTAQDWEQIKNLLRQIDVPPRQVLIDAKIYEVDLSGALSAGVSSYLDQKDTGVVSRVLNAAAGSGGLGVSVGALVLRSHELLGVLNASETKQQSRLISSPSIIATDSIPATMNVGQQVPVLTSQAVGGVQSGGSSLFTNTISNVTTGVTLGITARVNSSGVVTMEINQNVSSPQAPSTTGIQSPSFQQRSFSTQVTVQDGDTIAIGGFIQEQYGLTSSGVPFLHRIPVLGAAFGSKSMTKGRTELIIFLTPRVIYDTNQIADATDEIETNLKQIKKVMRDEK